MSDDQPNTTGDSAGTAPVETHVESKTDLREVAREIGDRREANPPPAHSAETPTVAGQNADFAAEEIKIQWQDGGTCIHSRDTAIWQQAMADDPDGCCG
jgi:hypothetical protein